MKLPPLTLPPITGTQGIFAQRRKGKSYTAQVQAEDFLDAEQQIAVIDPTGAWFGLRSSADGKSPGYPITIFGGEHADAPLERGSGAVIGEAMVTERFSAVLDLKLLDPEDWPVITADFLDTIYKLNRAPMRVFIDEVDQFAPQTTEDKAQTRCRRIVNRLVRLGGINGIGCTVITQRTAVLDKSILAQCETIVVLQMNGARDLKALRDELANHTKRDVIDEVIGSLGDLPRGQAWQLTPNTKTFERVAIRAKRTFDSGRTPDAGEILTPPKALAPIDLVRLGSAIAATIEKAKENDPTALRAKVARLEAQLIAGGAPAERIVEKLVEVHVPAITAAQLADLRSRIGEARDIIHDAQSVIEPVAIALKDIEATIHLIGQLPPKSVNSPGNRSVRTGETAAAKATPHVPGGHPTLTRQDRPQATATLVATPPVSPSEPAAASATRIDRQVILDAIATLETIARPVTFMALAAWLGVHPRNQSLLSQIGAARTEGHVEKLSLTGNGRAVARGAQPNAEAIRARFTASLSESQRNVLDVIASFEKLGREPSHAALALWLGVHPRNQSMLSDLGVLRSRGFLVDSALTDIGRRASTPRFAAVTVTTILADFDEQQRKIVELALKHGSIATMTVLSESLGLHPRNAQVLGNLGKLRERGLITKDWPLRATSVFPGVA